MFPLYRVALAILALILGITACGVQTPPEPALGTSTPLPSGTPVPATASSTATATETQTPSATATETPTPSASPTQTNTSMPSAVPTVDSLKAQVTADLLSCRYGPGPEYLYLYALRKTANIKLIGRTDGENWHWVYVDGRNKCWVNANFLEIQGDWLSLPEVYPDLARIPRSPYYAPTDFLGAARDGTLVEVSWNPIRLRAGDEEDESMLLYILEVWRCEGGQLLFEPLATNDTSVKFIDEPGCSEPSHGRHYFQEKHGYAGPVEVPWPAYDAQP